MSYPATPANPPVAGSKNLLPGDVNAPLPDRLAEHSGASGSKMVDYTRADGKWAPGYTKDADPEMTARGGDNTPDFSSGTPAGIDTGDFAEVAPGTLADRGNVFSSPKGDGNPNDVNAPAITPANPTTDGSNTPSWGGEGGPSSVA